MRHTPAHTPQTLEWSFADRLRKVRRDVAKVGQAEFAQALDVKLKAYSAWESGKNTPRELVAIAKRIELVTGVPASWMLGISEVVFPAATGTDAPQRKTTVWYSPRKSRTVVPFPQVRAV
jgi:DNA-binding XRE family transcriptional regulator